MRVQLTFFAMFVIATVLMGVLVLTALMTGRDTPQMIAIAAGAGFVLAVPITWVIVRKLTGDQE